MVPVFLCLQNCFPKTFPKNQACSPCFYFDNSPILTSVVANLWPVTEPQKAGIASFYPYNIGPGKCFPSTFYKRINTGYRKAACEALRWWIKTVAAIVV